MSATSSHAADVLVREVVQALFRAKPGEKVDYSAHNLTNLDLSGLDSKGALLTGADLYGVDFTNANVKGVDFSRTRLDRAMLGNFLARSISASRYAENHSPWKR